MDDEDQDHWRPRCTPPTGLVTPVPLDPTGKAGPTRGRARGRSWRATSHGLYVPSSVDGELVEQRILEQATRAGAAATVTGWAALRLAGGGFFDGLAGDGRTSLEVPLVWPSATRSPAGCRLIGTAVPESEVALRQGIRCAVPERALADAVITASGPRDGVVAIDMACAAELTSLSRLAAYAESHRRRRQISRLTRCLSWACEESRSPGETRMRLVWTMDARLPAPLCNRPIWTLGGDLIAIPDLFSPVLETAGEYDGGLHRGRDRHRRDTSRLEACAKNHIERFTVVAGDSDAVVLSRMQAAVGRARRRTPEPRTWTLEPPPDAWVPPGFGVSLDELLAMREDC